MLYCYYDRCYTVQTIYLRLHVIVFWSYGVVLYHFYIHHKALYFGYGLYDYYVRFIFPSYSAAVNFRKMQFMTGTIF